MLKCEMCLGRSLRGEMSVLRSVDRSIEYQAGTAIEITDDTHRINVKVDGITVKVNANGNLSVDIPDIYAVTAILETLSRYPLDHNYRDLRPLVPNGINQGKWATETVGANNKPIYMNQGVITASNANIGTNTKPVYMEGGEIKNSTANVGANNNPIFMNNGVLSASDVSIGAANKPIHMENGVIKASGANVGTATKPMYMNTGVLTQCNDTLDVNISGNAPKDALAQKIDETYLKGISVGADGTITVTRGDGQNTSYTSLKDFVDDITQNYVKRTPDDVSSNPLIINNGSIAYNKISAGSNYTTEISYFYKNGSNFERADFLAVPCKSLSFDSSKTYYKFDYATNDYAVFAATTLDFVANRDELFYIYDNQRSKTFEEELNEVDGDTTGKLYQQTVNAGGGSWDSNTDFPNGIPHSGVMTVIGRFETSIAIVDLTNNVTMGFVDRKHKYGTGSECISSMVIKGHRYRVDGFANIAIGFFGD